MAASEMARGWRMAEKRRALGRGLGALIPSAPSGSAGRPVDVFFAEQKQAEPTAAEAPDASGTDSAAAVTPRSTQDGSSTSASSSDAGVAVAETTSSGLAVVPGAEFAELDIDSIRPNPKQPRTVFDEDHMGELVHSIREIGVLQPIVVRRIPADQLDEADGKTFELIMGERRWRASQAADLGVIPAIIKDTSDDDLLRDALLENLHRSQLNPLEEAAAYQQLLDDFGCSHDQLATRIGRSRPQISNTLRLLRLPPLVQRRVAAGVLSAGHARALLGIEEAAAQDRLAGRVVAEGISVRGLEEIVAVGAVGAVEAPAGRRSRPTAPGLDDLAAGLSDRLDTRVRVDLGKRKGRITVEFASL